jgi:hypothetical protein
VAHGDRRCYSTAVGHGGRSLTPPPRHQMYSFAIFFGPYIFAKLRWKNVKKEKIRKTAAHVTLFAETPFYFKKNDISLL